jgi:hypothetical protein
MSKDLTFTKIECKNHLYITVKIIVERRKPLKEEVELLEIGASKLDVCDICN